MTKSSRRDLLKVGGAFALTNAIATTTQAALAADPYEDAILKDGPPAPISDGAFTIAVLPDTQNYSEKYPDMNGTGLRQRAQFVVQAKHDSSIFGSSKVAEHLVCRALG